MNPFNVLMTTGEITKTEWSGHGFKYQRGMEEGGGNAPWVDYPEIIYLRPVRNIVSD